MAKTTTKTSENAAKPETFSETEKSVENEKVKSEEKDKDKSKDKNKDKSKDKGKEKSKEKSKENKETKKKAVLGILTGVRVITESSDDAREFYHQSRFGTIADSGKVELSLLEALYLMERGRLTIKSSNGRVINFEAYVKKARKVEPNFWIRYIVFKDMRNRGYIIKTALKFGADFRVYDRGVKPGEDHARWIVFPVHEASTLTWHEFSAKNRVAHSTKKRLLMAIVDDENDVTYYTVAWIRP